MKNIVRLFSRLLAVALVWLQIPLCGSAQEPKTTLTSPDLQFASGHSARRIPFEFVANYIYLRGRANDSRPLWVLLQTGATQSYFDVHIAKTLGPRVQGESTRTVIIFSVHMQ